MKKRLKINGVIMAVAFLSVAAFPSIFMRNNPVGTFEEITEILGVFLILLGQIIRVSARGYKSEHSQEGYALIQSGPYGLARNPMYLGIVLIGLGVVLTLFKWWAAGIFLSVFAVRYLLLIFNEEEKLRQAFPGDFEEYCKKTPRMLPSLHALMTTEISEYLPIKLSWLKKEIGSMLTLLFVVLFVESWEDIRHEGIQAYLVETKWLLITVAIFIFLVLILSKRTIRLGKDGSDKSKTD